MIQKFIRIYQKMEIQEIQEHLLICGTLSASCAKCQKMGLKIDTEKCPECQTDFTYISFRNIKDHFPKIEKISETRNITIVDFEDFKRLSGELKAKEFFK